ncbi:MAG: hypothetical protein AAGE84_20155 [Cyanobacteria bacterium P01_G01_bin.39]
MNDSSYTPGDAFKDVYNLKKKYEEHLKSDVELINNSFQYLNGNLNKPEKVESIQAAMDLFVGTHSIMEGFENYADDLQNTPILGDIIVAVVEKVPGADIIIGINKNNQLTKIKHNISQIKETISGIEGENRRQRKELDKINQSLSNIDLEILNIKSILSNHSNRINRLEVSFLLTIILFSIFSINYYQDMQLKNAKTGINGEYDENGLAKRVKIALENENFIPNASPIDVAQTGTTVILKTNISDPDIIKRMRKIAKQQNGANKIIVEPKTN